MVNDAYAPELLCSLFLYDPVTGHLHHKANRRRVKAGSYADSTRRADGYRQVALRLDGKQYQLKAHRVAWILAHGAIPHGKQIDHINGIRDDNRLCNLRLVTQRENDQNRRKARGIAGIRAVANGRLTYALMVYSVTLAYFLPKRRRVLPI
ncbi:HNH endonuclease signature motif containing protein [Enterobacter hormaechei]